MNYITTKFNHMAHLGHNDVNEILQVQTMIVESLAIEAQRTFKFRDAFTYSNHLKYNMPLLGLRRGGQLVASAMMVFPDQYPNNIAFDRNLKGYPMSLVNHEKVSVIQGLMVTPEIQGKGLSRELLGLCAEVSVNVGRMTMMAKVARHNKQSRKSFANLGFHQVRQGYDSVKKHEVVYLIGDCFDVFKKANIFQGSRLSLSDNQARLTMRI